MTNPTEDTPRFKPYQESLSVTLLRTSSIAMLLALIVTRLRLRHFPNSASNWHLCIALALLFAWPSFGGHWVEILYLNYLRPRLAKSSNITLTLTRLTTWFLGGLILIPCGLVTFSLLTSNHLPTTPILLRTLLFAGPLMIAIELTVHTLLLLTRRPSFWNAKG